MLEILYRMQIFNFTSLTWTRFHALFLEKYMPRTFRDSKKDEFLAFEERGMTMAAYEAKFHALSRYSTQLVNLEDERIFFIY